MAKWVFVKIVLLIVSVTLTGFYIGYSYSIKLAEQNGAKNVNRAVQKVVPDAGKTAPAVNSRIP